MIREATGRCLGKAHCSSRLGTGPLLSGRQPGAAANPIGKNADGNQEVFLWIAGTHPSLRQVTDTKDDTVPSLNSVPYLIGSGRRLLFRSTADLDRRNPDNSPEIFLASGL